MNERKQELARAPNPFGSDMHVFAAVHCRTYAMKRRIMIMQRFKIWSNCSCADRLIRWYGSLTVTAIPVSLARCKAKGVAPSSVICGC